MSKKNIRVEVHKNEPDSTVKLGEDIILQHTAMGVSSPLAGNFDMVEFGQKITDSKTLRAEAKKKDEQGQGKYNKAEVICGIAQGQNSQTTGTMYTMTLSLRDYLLGKFRSAPEQLSEWSFNVVVSQTGGRRNVRVEIPLASPELLLKLCDGIMLKHTTDGASSILLNSNVDMTIFAAKLDEANTLVKEAARLREQKESKNNQALNILGYGKGQTSLTEGTIYFYHCSIRDFLLNKYAGTEEQLSEWGFEVVIGAARVGRKAKKALATPT